MVGILRLSWCFECMPKTINQEFALLIPRVLRFRRANADPELWITRHFDAVITSYELLLSLVHFGLFEYNAIGWIAWRIT